MMRVAGRSGGMRYTPNVAAMGAQSQLIEPPEAFGWSPPCAIYKTPAGLYTTTWDPRDYAPTGTAYYVDVATGDDGNAGTAEAPLKGIDTAMAKADCVVAYVKPGHYYRDQSMTAWPARNFSLRRWPGESGRILCSWAQTGLTFVNDPTYTNTWTTTRTNVLRVLDCINTDSDGDYVQLTHVADAATCNTTENSWATDGGTVYVNRADDAQPTFDNTWLLVAIAANTSMIGNYTWYIEYCDFLGMAVLLTSNATGQTPTLYAYHCTFKFAGGYKGGAGGNGNGISIDGSYAYLKDCVTAKCGNDGFNYDTANTNLPYGLELDTIAYANGVYSNTATAQGSSAHAGHVVRLNSEYYGNNQENAWDTEGLSWNLACNFHDPVGAAGADRDCNYRSSSTMWVDGCTSTGATYDLSCGAGDTIYYRDLTTEVNNAPGGSYIPY